MKLTKEALSQLSHEALVNLVLVSTRNIEDHAKRMSKNAEYAVKEQNHTLSSNLFHASEGLTRAVQHIEDTSASFLAKVAA